MLFNSAEFIIFLIAVFGVTWALARWHLLQTLFLLAASYFFYAAWNPYYLVLIWFSSTLDFLMGGAIFRSNDASRRKLYLYTSLLCNLGILAVFKYFNFFATEAAAALTQLGVAVDPVLLNVALPVGISFFTFQSLSYTFDIYRREMQPARTYWHYLLFVSFFPQLVAGPIVRAADLLPELQKTDRVLTRQMGGVGLFLIVSGLVKKVAIADYLGVNLVDRVFENPSWFTSVEVLAAVYGYAFQIYCDFSGYSDVAIGAALLLGCRLMDNFRMPYAAVDLRDFWRRWHISLSTWLRDYLYVVLGGSRKGPARTYVALAVTMLLGGLWHGAAWTFVIWGALHGLGLAATRFVQRLRGSDQGQASSWWARLIWIVLTFHFVCFCWIFFRAQSVGHAWAVLRQLATFTGGAANLASTVMLALGAALVLHHLPEAWVERVRALFVRLPAPVQGLLLVGVAVALAQVAQSKVVPYIYFQF
jgi:D-alanyl-lipoteichoic acid acyltransferase DltB (MBOAT superfamily)